jgi:hypothetical protein
VNCRVFPIAIEPGDGVTAIETSAGGKPVPLSATCGELIEFPRKVNVPVLIPVACGENDTAETQLEPGASVFGLIGQVEVATKSLELLVILEIVSGPGWLLVSVTDFVGLGKPLT